MVLVSLQGASRSSYLRRLPQNPENRNLARQENTARDTRRPPQPKRTSPLQSHGASRSAVRLLCAVILGLPRLRKFPPFFRASSKPLAFSGAEPSSRSPTEKVTSRRRPRPVIPLRNYFES